MSPEISAFRSTVLAQLDRVISSASFAQSERMCRFLRMTVNYALENRSDQLKEYAIGLEVFDRKPDFDPRLDPIVRVEARRLRRKLARYYEAEGMNDELRFDLPKGAYALRVERNGSPARHQPRMTAPAAREAAIAVIPFANLAAGEEHQYFSDGLTQELILGLTRCEGLRVVAWNTATHLRGDQDFGAIGERLKVSAVLTGSVRASASRLRVTAQLIDTCDSSYLWSEAYDREISDILRIQDEISRAIVDTLRLRLSEHLSYSPQTPAAWDDKALDLYFRGRFEWSGRTPDGLRRSVDLLRRALDLEPRFALAWAALADSYTLLFDNGIAAPEDSMGDAKRAALHALELDPSLGEAWASLGLIAGQFEWNYAEAERCYRRAILLNPGYATAHHWYSVDHLALLGRFQEAEAEIMFARRLDPFSTVIIEGHGYLSMLQRRYDEAIAIISEALAIDPAFYRAWSSIGRALIQKGAYEEALAALGKARAMAGEVSNILAAIGQAHALSGDTEKARTILSQLNRNAAGMETPMTSLAIVHLGLGENDAALAALERAVERRETTLNKLKVHPVFDPLRDSPRFHALLRRTGLE